MNKTHYYTDERTFWHCTGVQSLFLPIGDWVEPPVGSYGADTPASKRRIINLIRASGLDRQITVKSAEPAQREDLLRIHPAEYLDKFKALSDENGGELGTFAPFSKGGYEIACLSTGLAITSLESVVTGAADNAYALCRPAGHHCLAGESMGFCLFANIPVAIEAVKARHGTGRVAVVDWDVHHGNGTQSIYYERDDVLTISLHQDRCFPPGYSGFEDRGAAYGIQVSNTAGTDWVVFGIAQAPISPTDPAPSLVANMVEEGFPSPISLAGIELCADASDPTCTADALELVLTLTRTDIGGTDFLVPSCSLNVIGGPFDGIGADCTPSGLGDGRLSDAEAHSALLLNTVPEPGLAWLVAPALAAALRRRFVDRTPAPKLSGARSGRLHGRIS